MQMSLLAPFKNISNFAKMSLMKYRILLLLLFFIASFATALHEVEHISQHHDTAQCQTCIVDHQLISGDIVALFEESQEIHFKEVFTQTKKTDSDKTLLDYNNRAPPLIF